MRLQRMLGHLTTLIPTNPKQVLVIGCGAGVTAGAVSIDPMVEQLTIAEIEPLVPRVVSTYFAEHNFNVVNEPEDRRAYRRRAALPAHDRREVRRDHLGPARSVGQGRGDALHARVLRAGQAHLNPGGVVTLFVQLYESNTEAVKSEIATFIEVFPNGMVWGNTHDGARLRPGAARAARRHEPINVDADRAAAAAAGIRARCGSRCSEIGMNSAVDLFSTYAGTRDRAASRGWRTPGSTATATSRLQYLAGLGLNLYQSESIYADMLQHAQRLSEQPVRGLAGHDQRAARRDPAGAGAVAWASGVACSHARPYEPVHHLPIGRTTWFAGGERPHAALRGRSGRRRTPARWRAAGIGAPELRSRRRPRAPRRRDALASSDAIRVRPCATATESEGCTGTGSDDPRRRAPRTAVHEQSAGCVRGSAAQGCPRLCGRRRLTARCGDRQPIRRVSGDGRVTRPERPASRCSPFNSVRTESRYAPAARPAPATARTIARPHAGCARGSAAQGCPRLCGRRRRTARCR